MIDVKVGNWFRVDWNQFVLLSKPEKGSHKVLRVLVREDTVSQMKHVVYRNRSSRRLHYYSFDQNGHVYGVGVLPKQEE